MKDEALKLIQAVGASTMPCASTGFHTLQFDAAKAVTMAAVEFLQNELGLVAELDAMLEAVRKTDTGITNFENPLLAEARDLLEDVQLEDDCASGIISDSLYGRITQFLTKSKTS